MQWEKVPTDDIITCPECGSTHIRISKMVEQVFEQIKDRITLDLLDEMDCPEKTQWTCLNEKCSFSWDNDPESDDYYDPDDEEDDDKVVVCYCERCKTKTKCRDIPLMGYSEWMCKSCAAAAYRNGEAV